VLPEQYYDNNVLSLNNYLMVQHDVFRPVMDVTIDGRYIVNGDFVSSNPLIRIKVWDENRNKRKTNTDGMRIFLTYPCDTGDCEPVAIDLNSEVIEWTPATATTEFIMDFHPVNLEDGVYTLMIEGVDAENNSSGRYSYEVNFVVSSEQLVKISIPYPNPFNSSIHFPILIGNDDLPSAFTFQIMNVNGQVVTDLSEGYNFHTGTNNMSWDGTTSNGSMLPNGIYVYRISMEVAGKSYNRNGKLVLVR
jgi:FlgD Ig-like domain